MKKQRGKRSRIRTEKVRGKFTDISVEEKGKLSGLLILAPSKKRLPNLYVTRVSPGNVHMDRSEASEQLESRGASRKALAEMGLISHKKQQNAIKRA